MPSLGHLIYRTDRSISKTILYINQDLHCCQVLCLPVVFWGKFIHSFCHAISFVWNHLSAHSRKHTLLYSLKSVPKRLLLCGTRLCEMFIWQELIMRLSLLSVFSIISCPDWSLWVILTFVYSCKRGPFSLFWWGPRMWLHEQGVVQICKYCNLLHFSGRNVYPENTEKNRLFQNLRIWIYSSSLSIVLLLSW